MTIADFRAYLPDHSYIFTPTGAFWSMTGVNACLGRGNRQGTEWLDRNQPVHHLTWAPGHPMLIENQLVVDGGWIKRNGVTTFNLYRPPTLKHGDAVEGRSLARTRAQSLSEGCGAPHHVSGAPRAAATGKDQPRDYCWAERRASARTRSSSP